MSSTQTSQKFRSKASKPTKELLRLLGMSPDDFADNIARFCSDSASIEGEDSTVQDIRAAIFFLSSPIITIDLIKATHKIMTGHKGVDWSGKWREVDVSVGEYAAPSALKVNEMMNELVGQIDFLRSLDLHNIFEKIHPFQDYNGRMGRLLWLHQSIYHENYDFRLSFLHRYYYQTLSRYEEPFTSR